MQVTSSHEDNSLLFYVLEQLDVEVFITDPESDRVLFMNRLMREKFGVTEENPCCWQVLEPNRTQRCPSCPAFKLDENPDGVYEWETDNAVSGRRYRNINKTIPWIDGRRVHLHQCYDITHEWEDQQRLMQARQQAEQAAQAKSDFLSRMSHEICTPINAIIGMTHIAQVAQTLEKSRECLQKIDYSSKQLLGIINDVLDMSKIESRKLELVDRIFDLEQMLVEVAGIITVKADEKRQKFHIQMDMNMPKYFIGDALRLSQVLLNLLSNAVKFTPERGRICISAEKLGENGGYTNVRFSVTDTGIGIAKDIQAHMFDSFEQAEGGIARRFGGTGLGLAISKSLIEMMGGTISVISEPDKGSTFICELPLKNADRKETVVGVSGDIELKSVRALMIDDAEEVRDYFLQIMKGFGIFAQVAAGFDESLKLIGRANKESRPFKVIFVAVRVSGSDGIEIAKRIKNVSPMSELVLMVCSDRSGIEVVARAAGIKRFIPKPLFPSTILNTLQEIVGLPTRRDHPLREDGRNAFRGYRVLVVEDVEINREIVLQELDETGVLLTFVENGKKAFEELSSDPEKYDLILMDIHMPIMDGLEATKQIRSSGWRNAADIPIIAMTANTFHEDVQKCLDAGMNGHIAKPLEFERLFETLRQYLTEFKSSVEVPDMDINPKDESLDIKAYVNSEEALARIRGNKAIYKALMGSFVKNTQLQQMKDEIGAGDFEAAARSAHAIKGVSANLSLPAVTELAVLLESQLKSGIPVDESFAKLEEAMEITLRCIDKVLSEL